MTADCVPGRRLRHESVLPRQTPTPPLSDCGKPVTRIHSTMEYVRQRSPTGPMGTSSAMTANGCARYPSARTQLVVHTRSHNKTRQHMLAISENIAEPSDPLLPHIALQRWETDGGAQPPQPRSRLRCRTPEHPASRRQWGRRARYVATGTRPADRTGGGRTGRHRQATRIPARIRPLRKAGRRPSLPRGTPPVSHPRHRRTRRPTAHERTPPQ